MTDIAPAKNSLSITVDGNDVDAQPGELPLAAPEPGGPCRQPVRAPAAAPGCARALEAHALSVVMRAAR